MTTLQASSELAAPAKRPENDKRMGWVDNLRTITILLVVNIHACVTYSHVGSWYFMNQPEPPILVKIPFAIWEGHLQSFFMGLLFFVGGYFADRSLSRRGVKGFLGERFRRLALPTLLYMLVIHPFIICAFLLDDRSRAGISAYMAHYYSSGQFIGGSGPMWFAFALLLFSLPLLLFRSTKVDPRPITLKPSTLLALAATLALGSFLVRIVQPVGTNIINFQLCYFTQYVVVFALGVLVSRRDGLNSLAASPLAARAGWLALVLGPIALLSVVATAVPLGKDPGPVINGGWHWQALAMATWEQFVGVGLGVGMMALCYRRFAESTRGWKWLSQRSFGVYLLHPPILVGLAVWMQSWHGNPYLMAVTLTCFGLILSFLAADLARRAPLLRSIL